MPINVLVIEDEENMRNMIHVYLFAHGINVTEVENGAQALQLLKERIFDVIVLDIMMPVMDGFSFLKQYSFEIPILILSAKTQMDDKLQGFDLGIDDYLTKPCDLRELVARIRVLAKRKKSNTSKQIQEMVRLNHDSHSLYLHEHEVQLTPKEFEILNILSNHPRRVFSRDELLIKVWGYEYRGEDRAVDTHVKNIREKCKKTGIDINLIQTVWGVGYRYGGIEFE